MKLAALMLPLVACSPEPTSTVVELPPAALPSPPPATATSLPPTSTLARAECAPPPSLAGCKEVARARVGPIQASSATCSIDTRLGDGEVGTLLLCPSGAVIRFPRGGIFSGDEARSDSIRVCAKTKFPYRGCMWESTQRITGVSNTLRFEYSERVVEGHDCEGAPCTASATIELYP